MATPNDTPPGTAQGMVGAPTSPLTPDQLAALMAARAAAGGTPPPSTPAPRATAAPGLAPPDAAHGGFDPGTYVTNPDGTITFYNGQIRDPQTGQPNPNAKPLGTVNLDGSIVDPSGKPTGSWATFKPGTRTPSDDPNYNGSGWADTAQNAITKDNPVAGTINAGIDAAQGNFKQAAGDALQGATFGGATLDKNGNPIPGDTGRPVATAATGAATAIGSGLAGALGGIGGGGAIDPTAAASETARANALADALGTERQGVAGNIAADRTAQGQTRDQEDASIAGLTSAANGTAPSAAELMLRQQGATDSARQFGQAAALGGESPGGALRQASMGAAQIAGQTDANAAITRANEQATARTALAAALQQKRAQDQAQGQLDTGQQSTLLNGQVSSQGQGVTSTGQVLDAQAKAAAAKAQLEGAAIGGGAALLGGLIKSDARAKTEVKAANLADALAAALDGKGKPKAKPAKSLADSLGDQVHGVTFEYLPGQEDGGAHFGIIAQQLERAIPGVVSKGADGLRRVDTGHLSLGNTAMVAELAKRVQELEAAIPGKRGRS